MKKAQSSQRKIIANNVKQSQKKITSFFTKEPKFDEKSDNKIVSDNKSISPTIVDKKRKKRDSMSEEDSYKNIKKNRTDDIKLVNHVKSCKDPVFSSANKELKNICNNYKENKGVQQGALPQKINAKETDIKLITETKYSETKIIQNLISPETADILNDTNIHILKEPQNLNVITSQLSVSPGKAYSHNDKIKLSDSKIKSKEFSVACADEFKDLFDQEWHMEAQINFTTLQRCKVIDVKYEPKVTVLTVRQVKSEAVDTVACSGSWKDVRVKVDDVVTIQAKKEPQQWIVDNNNGFLVIQPDRLISGTTITSSLFCNRRAVLTEKFRKIESLPNENADYSVMTVGSLVHQWLQKALRENVHMLSDVIKLLDNMLQSKDTIDYLYASEMSLADCRKRMMEYAPRIFEFIQHYIKGNQQQHINNLKDNFQGNICKIQDIEENIWIPKLGIKGRIDVTAEVNINSRRKIMPLEVKTGRVSYSLEHKAQVILYLVMMNMTDEKIDTGLLLYLKENAMQEIKSTHHERRDLILLRNTLAHYFAQQTVNSTSAISEFDALKTMELPEPINHHSACTRCPYQTLCCTFLTKDSNANLAPSHPLTPLIKQLLSDFESSHLDYVIKWISLLQMIESYDSDDNNLSNLWTLSPEKREAKGTCLCNLKIIREVVKQDDKYLYTFARADVKGGTIKNVDIGGTFVENDYIIISTDTQINIATGYVLHVLNDTITILLDKDITRGEDIQRCATFHLDKYLSVGSIFTFDYANVAGLLNTDETSTRLRHIVIDKKPAAFTKSLPRSIVSASTEIICDLNENQQRAVLRAVMANEYILIKGMPGTGKTQTLVVLIELLLKFNFTVLITAHTHSAVDNILLKLLERNIDFLRLGSTRQVHPLLTDKTERCMTRCCDTPESLEAFYNDKRVVGVTCYGAYHPLLRRRSFDVCVVDESAQIMQSTVLRPLYSARRFVLVGDPDQLSPVIKCRTAVKLGAAESLFARLDSESNTINLTKQYRMNSRIMKLANDVTYLGKLIPGNKQVENATLISTNIEVLSSCESWVRKALCRHLSNSVMVLNTGSTYNLSVNNSDCNGSVMSDQVYSNEWEARIVLRLVRVLIEMGVQSRNIGIIAPYNAHVILLKKIVNNKEVEVNTVDQYQGRDKDIVLYSCARSVQHEHKREQEILDDQRRLTVAITRAKHKLIVIADMATVARYAPFKKLFGVIDEKNVINLHNGEEEFNWQSLIPSTLQN